MTHPFPDRRSSDLRFPGSGNPVADELTGMIAKIGENMSLRRAAGVTVGNGVVCSYIHNQTAPGAGKIGVLIGLESGGDKAKLEALGRQLAMHVAAARPQALDRSGVNDRKSTRLNSSH